MDLIVVLPAAREPAGPVTGHRSLVTALAATLLCAACAQLPEAEPDTVAQIESAIALENQESLEPQQTAPATEKAPVRKQVKATDQPAPPADAWDRVRAGFRLSDLNGPLVEAWERWYSSRPGYVAQMVARSSRYLYHVIEEVERRNMPAEIALLPMIESAYNPQAYSRAHASGMWQFIPSTAQIYGLRRNHWYDGRRDILAATSAALDYLEKLHAQFNDWNLALASYNWGEGAVARAIARNQARGLPVDYESLRMPAETRNYIPKLQAVKNIIANPEQYGLTLAPVPNQPYFATVTMDRHIDIELAAKLAEMPLEEFRFLNPAHNKPVIKADGTETIVLPIDKVAVFQGNLEGYSLPLVSWQTYTVKRSDRPETIAKKHGITVSELKSINGINGRKRIIAGQTLIVPLNGEVEPHLPDLPAPRITRAAYRPKYKCYMTEKGKRRQVPCAEPKKRAAPKAAAKRKDVRM